MTFPYSTACWYGGFFKKANLVYFLAIHSSYSYFVSIDFNHSYMFINGSPPCCERELLPSPKGMVFMVESIIWENEVGLSHCHWLKSCSHQKPRTTHGTDGKWWTARTSTGEIFKNQGISIFWLWTLSYGKVDSQDHKEIVWYIGCQNIS